MKFIKENNINYSDIVILEHPKIKKIKSNNNENELKKFLEDNKLIYEIESKNLNNNINSRNRAYSLEGILFFSENNLIKISDYLKTTNNMQNSIFTIKYNRKKYQYYPIWI